MLPCVKASDPNEPPGQNRQSLREQIKALPKEVTSPRNGLTFSDLEKFQIGRSKADVLNDLQWRVGHTQAGVVDGKQILMLDYTLFLEPESRDYSASFHAVFVNGTFDRLLPWDHGGAGVVPRLGEIFTFPTTTINDLRKGRGG
jgi:hypothetical protein